MAIIFATWTPPSYAFTKDFLVELKQGATLIDSQAILPGFNRYQSPAVTNGLTYTVRVDVRSTLGILSPIASVDVVATGDTVAQYQFQTPTLVNMRECYNWATGERYWITSFAADTFAALFASSLDSYTNPLASYHASGTSSITTEEFDTGATYNTAWDGELDVDTISGTPSKYIELRVGVAEAWTRHAGNHFVGTGRRVRLSSETTGTDTQRVNDLGEIIVTA